MYSGVLRKEWLFTSHAFIHIGWTFKIQIWKHFGGTNSTYYWSGDCIIFLWWFGCYVYWSVQTVKRVSTYLVLPAYYFIWVVRKFAILNETKLLFWASLWNENTSFVLSGFWLNNNLFGWLYRYLVVILCCFSVLELSVSVVAAGIYFDNW